MLLDEDSCYRAQRSRDARFDGHFFIAVKTTGIYCRPICPARTPLRKNVRYFACAAAAEEAGFRPCRRCRPDAAPGTPAWVGTSATVTRALRLIDEGALDHGSIDSLADRVGVGERQLRRLFDKHLGASPLSIAQSRRAHFARSLLDATSWPMTEIAHASGFRSLRQFNDVIRSVFRAPPSKLRRAQVRGKGTLSLSLAFRPPLEWEKLLTYLSARCIPGVERVEDGRYLRTFEGASVEISRESERSLRLSTDATGTRLLSIVRRARRLFDLDADPSGIAAVLGKSPLLAASVKSCPGLRVPGAWDPFEYCVRAIVGQQVTVRAASTIAGRIAARWGLSPKALAKAPLEEVGLPRARAECLRGVAKVAAADREGLRLDALRGLPGIGPWTTEVLSMRAFHEPDAFPSSDLVLLRCAGLSSPKKLEALAEQWRPWRAYAAMHLWNSPLKHVEVENGRALAG